MLSHGAVEPIVWVVKTLRQRAPTSSLKRRGPDAQKTTANPPKQTMRHNNRPSSFQGMKYALLDVYIKSNTRAQLHGLL